MRCDVSSTIPKPSTRVHHGSHRLTEDKKLHFLKSQVKTLLTWFYDLKGIIHRDFIPEGETITGKYYWDATQHSWWRINRSRPEYQDPGSWYLLHNNSPPQKTSSVAELLAKKKSLCHSRLVVFTRFVAVWLLLVPKIENGDERSILWWYWSHTNCCDEGCWGSPKDGLTDIHPCIGSACPAVHWCTRDIFWINILNSGKIWYLYFVFKKFDFFSNTLCTSHCLPKSSQREEVIPKNEKWTPVLALWQFDSTKCS